MDVEDVRAAAGGSFETETSITPTLERATAIMMDHEAECAERVGLQRVGFDRTRKINQERSARPTTVIHDPSIDMFFAHNAMG